MARRLVERTFDPKKPLVARRSFTASGRHFGVGDAFDWKHMAVAQRRVLQMFEANLVGHPDDGGGNPPPAPVAPPESDPDVDQSTDNSDLAVDSLAALQEIARAEGAPIKTTKIAQREAIIAHRGT
jgi:hypothetical protein